MVPNCWFIVLKECWKAHESSGYRGKMPVNFLSRPVLSCTPSVLKGLDALMSALQTWNGGVIIISHDERFITTVAKEVCVMML